MYVLTVHEYITECVRLLYTVESLTKVHFRTAHVVLCKEVVHIGRLKMYWEKKIGTSNSVLCREAVFNSVSTIRDFTVQ